MHESCPGPKIVPSPARWREQQCGGWWEGEVNHSSAAQLGDSGADDFEPVGGGGDGNGRRGWPESSRGQQC